jgi:hypothetical protein
MDLIGRRTVISLTSYRKPGMASRREAGSATFEQSVKMAVTQQYHGFARIEATFEFPRFLLSSTE